MEIDNKMEHPLFNGISKIFCHLPSQVNVDDIELLLKVGIIDACLELMSINCSNVAIRNCLLSIL